MRQLGIGRFVLEQFEFPYEVVYAQTLEAGNLKSQFDVLVFVTGAIPETDRVSNFNFFGGTLDSASIPDEYRAWLGRVTVTETVPNLIEFMEDGGTIIAIGSSTALAKHAALPLVNHLVDGHGEPLTAEHYYVPGSVLEVRVDNTRPLAYGMDENVHVFFNNSPVLRALPDAHQRGVTSVAWFDSAEPLRSGWAWGQHYLEGGVAIAEASVGQGKLFLFGPEITNRGQPHGTFKFLFNGIYLAGAKEQRLELTN